MLNKLEWHTEQRKISDLIPWGPNPRQMTEKQVNDLRQSLERFNLMSIPVINIDNTIVSGHQRIKIMQLLGKGEEIIDVRVPNRKLSNEEFREANLRENKNVGEWNFDELANWDTDLLLEVGWDDEELKDIFQLNELPSNGGGSGDPDQVPDPPKEPICKPGDLWQLGRHRLLCGDSTKRDNVERLAGEGKIDMVFTDPPYGIKIVKSKKVGGGGNLKFGKVGGENWIDSKTYHEIINDDSTITAKNVYDIFKQLGISNIILFGGNYFTDFLPPSPCWIIWDKENTGNFADVEIAWTSYQRGAKLYRWMWNGLTRKGNRNDELISRVHPTQKPVGLFVEILKDFSENNQIIFDPFGGSGSTLIACEKTGRQCQMMEIDPLYVDIIIARWEDYTGQKAVKL